MCWLGKQKTVEELVSPAGICDSVPCYMGNARTGYGVTGG